MARGWGFKGLVLGGACVATMTAGRPATAEGGQGPHVYLSDGVARSVVAHAIEGAKRRLNRPACLLVLNDFTDSSGRPLADALAATGRPAAEYVTERIWFVDGSDAACRDSVGKAAFTAVDSKVVRVCSGHFAALADRSTAAEMLIIHELLHTLGLGENPPSSAEITHHVTKRCGGS